MVLWAFAIQGMLYPQLMDILVNYAIDIMPIFTAQVCTSLHHRRAESAPPPTPPHCISQKNLYAAALQPPRFFLHLTFALTKI